MGTSHLRGQWDSSVQNGGTRKSMHTQNQTQEHVMNATEDFGLRFDNNIFFQHFFPVPLEF